MNRSSERRQHTRSHHERTSAHRRHGGGRETFQHSGRETKRHGRRGGDDLTTRFRYERSYNPFRAGRFVVDEEGDYQIKPGTENRSASKREYEKIKPPVAAVTPTTTATDVSTSEKGWVGRAYDMAKGIVTGVGKGIVTGSTLGAYIGAYGEQEGTARYNALIQQAQDLTAQGRRTVYDVPTRVGEIKERLFQTVQCQRTWDQAMVSIMSIRDTLATVQSFFASTNMTSWSEKLRAEGLMQRVEAIRPYIQQQTQRQTATGASAFRPSDCIDSATLVELQELERATHHWDVAIYRPEKARLESAQSATAVPSVTMTPTLLISAASATMTGVPEWSTRSVAVETAVNSTIVSNELTDAMQRLPHQIRNHLYSFGQPVAPPSVLLAAINAPQTLHRDEQQELRCLQTYWLTQNPADAYQKMEAFINHPRLLLVVLRGATGPNNGCTQQSATVYAKVDPPAPPRTVLSAPSVTSAFYSTPTPSTPATASTNVNPPALLPGQMYIQPSDWALIQALGY